MEKLLSRLVKVLSIVFLGYGSTALATSPMSNGEFGPCPNDSSQFCLIGARPYKIDEQWQQRGIARNAKQAVFGLGLEQGFANVRRQAGLRDVQLSLQSA